MQASIVSSYHKDVRAGIELLNFFDSVSRLLEIQCKYGVTRWRFGDCAEGGFIRIVAHLLEHLVVMMDVLAIPGKRMDAVEILTGTAEATGKRETARQAGASMGS